jgi:redox-sensitive bicupin YhaK (pirin superfamily)
MEITGNSGAVVNVEPLGFPWKTKDPFLFCVYHADSYPNGNETFGPDASLVGRNLGNDFVLKDGWRMYHGKEIPGFPVHPHRGFETVTVVRKGVVDHSDSFGGAGRYGNGDVQWMTAGKGIQHAEMFPLINRNKPNPLELFQIWLNLPRAKKFAEPHYAMLWNEMIPVYTGKDRNDLSTRIEIVAGSLAGQSAPEPAPDSWAADPVNEVAIWYFQMEPGALWTLPLASSGIKRTLYFFEGDQIKINSRPISAGNSVEVLADQKITIINGQADGRFLMLQGKPINEPVASYGPFVMNTREEIQKTFRDYQETRFGGWPWPRHDQVHDHQARFARHANGREELPPDQ